MVPTQRHFPTRAAVHLVGVVCTSSISSPLPIALYVRLQTFVEVGGAYDSVNNSDEDADDCEDREGGEGVSCGIIVLTATIGVKVHAEKLEEKVG